MAGKITPSLEDYLETIYFIYLKNHAVRVTDVAVEMGISKPSVNKAINNLKNKGYVNHELYGLLSLTDEGMDIAKSVARRHETITRFLSKIIGVDEETAEKEACLIEHTLSAETFDKLETFVDGYLAQGE